MPADLTENPPLVSGTKKMEEAMVENAHSTLLEGLGHQESRIFEPQGRAELVFRVAEQHCHLVAQGGYVTAWIDAAMAHAVHAAASQQLGCNTLEIKVAFYKPVLVGQTVTAIGWVERLGRSIAFTEGELQDESGKVLAKATSTAQLNLFRSREAG